MRKLLQKIQSPTALFAFEAAARHLSFTRAARELNVSQPAVSLSVKRLEEALGTSLFERRHRSIELTPAGEKFHADVSFGLMHILNSAESVSNRRTEEYVALSCSTAFAHYWMLPRLATFRRDNPDIDFRLQTTDKDLDIAEEGIAFAVRLGAGSWPGYHALRLGPERVYPVCSPAYLERVGTPTSDAQLMSLDLLHLEEPFRRRTGWREWFAAQGLEYDDSGHGLRLNDYALVIQAAIAGEGIAYGWHHIVERLVAQGLLKRLGKSVYDVGQGHYVIWPQRQEPGHRAQRVLAWLKTQASRR